MSAINLEVIMSNQRYILILLAGLNLNCAVASNQNPLLDQEDNNRAGMTVAHSQISDAATEADTTIANAETVRLTKSSAAFNFLKTKKGARYKISRNGCINHSQITQFVECLGEDITGSEELLDAVSRLSTQYEEKQIEEKKYLESLRQYGLTEESNIAQYLRNTRKRIDTLRSVRTELEALRQ